MSERASISRSFTKFKSKEASSQPEMYFTHGEALQANQRDGATSQNSPSCYRAVIAAASTNIYRSSHASTYINNHFDADDESEHHRDSYLRLLQSHNSILPSHLGKATSRPLGVCLLAKSPSEQMVSISEEQSTRKQNLHLKSGSLPEFMLLKGTGPIEVSGGRMFARASDCDIGPQSDQEQHNPNRDVTEIQDSLAHKTERGDET